MNNRSSHIPYRDSKLTHYLKDSFGNNSKLLMILQISQLDKDVGDTISTLNFGQRVLQIQKGQLVPQILNK